MNKNKIIGCCLLLMLCFCKMAIAQQRILLSNFGAKPDSYENASPALVRAIEQCRKFPNATLVLPGGRLDLWPDGAYKQEIYISNSTENDTLPKVKNVAFLLKEFKNLTIEGNGTQVFLHGKMVAFALFKSSNITIRNLSFDYERPTMSELMLTSVSPTKVEAKLHPDTRYFIKNGKLGFYGEGWKSSNHHTIVFNEIDETLKYSSFKVFLESKAEEKQKGEVVFTGDFSKTKLKAGEKLSIRDPYRDNCGGFISLSQNVLLQNLHLHFMHGLGVVSQFSENITIRKVNVAPRPESGRIISAFADCFHFSGCKGKVLVDSCTTSGAHDDPINVHGTHLQIVAKTGSTKLTVRFMHHQTYGFEAFFKGDSIAFVNPKTLQPIAYAKLKNAVLKNKREMEIETDKPFAANVAVGQCIENLTWTPEVTIRNCRFERTNTRGILMTTRRKVVIENNHFYKTGMHAILIADDAASWFESGPVQDVVIRNNVFEECGYNSTPGSYVIAIAPENHDLVNGFYVHRNILIENNTFKTSVAPLLTAKSVDGLVFRQNKIISSKTVNVTADKTTFHIEACKNVTLTDNSFPADNKPMLTTSHMEKSEVKMDW
ncbi:hypothetical protein FHS57_001867 [Runella defluvii]|uniref:Right-handed parallel beta-helix repeat-containing protein n=1 Tax=Runella defluvii TaxID=370973 RepID=A0A7W6EPQ1_9BACT|nr:right-handed parallel beta-helix repeat-containing protein [Runella defluvii]MBB3837870.1 hypothetical protein [Runella defluvii]